MFLFAHSAPLRLQSGPNPNYVLAQGAECQKLWVMRWRTRCELGCQHTDDSVVQTDTFAPLTQRSRKVAKRTQELVRGVHSPGGALRVLQLGRQRHLRVFALEVLLVRLRVGHARLKAKECDISFER